MEGKFGGEWIRVCVWLHSFTAQMKLSQYCWFAIARYNIKSSKREKKNCEEVAEGRDMGRDHRGITHHPQELSFFFRETMWGSKEETEQAPSPLAPHSVGKWGSCRFHRTLGQNRNHSPQCKPPVLQDISNLEQETTVTQTLMSLSLTPPLTRTGDGKAPEHGDGPFSSGLCQVPHPRWPQVRGGHATF